MSEDYPEHLKCDPLGMRFNAVADLARSFFGLPQRIFILGWNNQKVESMTIQVASESSELPYDSAGNQTYR